MDNNAKHQATRRPNPLKSPCPVSKALLLRTPPARLVPLPFHASQSSLCKSEAFFLTTFDERREMASTAQMSVDRPKPPKLNVDEYLTTALVATPAELHPFFESFRTLHERKCVPAPPFPSHSGTRPRASRRAARGAGR